MEVVGSVGDHVTSRRTCTAGTSPGQRRGCAYASTSVVPLGLNSTPTISFFLPAAYNPALLGSNGSGSLFGVILPELRWPRFSSSARNRLRL